MKMSPIPMPMTQAVKVNMRSLMLVRALTTAPNSGMDLSWLANTFILSACSFNLWSWVLALG